MKMQPTSVLLLLAGLVAAAPAEAGQTPYFGDPVLVPNMARVTRYLSAGTHTVETKNLTGTAPDPVVHVLIWTSSGYQQVASDDDLGTGVNSLATVTLASSTYVYIYIRGFSSTSGGKADLAIDGVTTHTQLSFGSTVVPFTWGAGDKISVVGSSSNEFGGVTNDFSMFLLTSNLQMMAFDDDSGPNYYPLVTAPGAGENSAKIAIGTWPGTRGSGRLIADFQTGICFIGQPCSYTHFDTDADSLSNDMEALIGSNPNTEDTDGDMVLDGKEFWGNDGFSFSEYGTVVRRTAFVEVDWMESATRTYLRPYGNMPLDVRTIFASDGNSDVNVFLDSPVPWHALIGLWSASCWLETDCVNFDDVKATNFTRPYKELFHYFIFAEEHSTLGECSSGIADEPGNDGVVALGCAGGGTSAQQRGTFIHEFGHNLGLDHNDNDSNSGENSTIHESVMNYRYQMTGIPSLGGKHTYSVGPDTQCATWTTTTKDNCDWPWSSDTCDCDRDEWGRVSYDFSGAWSVWVDGAAQAPRNEPDEKLFGAATLPTRYAPTDLRKEPDERRRVRMAARANELTARGQQEGRDFRVSPDGLRIVSVCR